MGREFERTPQHVMIHIIRRGNTGSITVLVHCRHDDIVSGVHSIEHVADVVFHERGRNETRLDLTINRHGEHHSHPHY